MDPWSKIHIPSYELRGVKRKEKNKRTLPAPTNPGYDENPEEREKRKKKNLKFEI